MKGLNEESLIKFEATWWVISQFGAGILVDVKVISHEILNCVCQ